MSQDREDVFKGNKMENENSKQSPPQNAYEDMIDKAGGLIHSKHPLDALIELIRIQTLHQSVINKSARLTLALSSNMGMAYYHLDKIENPEGTCFLERAIEEFTKFLEIGPEAENVLFMRAMCYDYIEEIKLAQRDYEEVIRINPSAKNAHAHLAYLLEHEGFHDDAIHLYQIAIKVDPNDMMSQERLNNLMKNNN